MSSASKCPTGGVVSEAQLEYDKSPALRDLLARAASSPTVRRRRHRLEHK